MIKYLICLLWGHKIRQRVCTDIDGNIHTYIWEWFDKCPRCGKDIKGEKK